VEGGVAGEPISTRNEDIWEGVDDGAHGLESASAADENTLMGKKTGKEPLGIALRRTKRRKAKEKTAHGQGLKRATPEYLLIAKRETCADPKKPMSSLEM